MTKHERPASAHGTRSKVAPRLPRVLAASLAVVAVAAVGLRSGPVAEAWSKKAPQASPSESAPGGSKRASTGSSDSTSTTTSSTSTTTTSTTVAPTTTTTVAPTTTTTMAPAPTSSTSLLWHADADADNDLGSHTMFMDKNTELLPTSRLSIVADPLGRYGKVYRANLTAADINSGAHRAEWNEAFLGDGETELNLWGESAPRTTELYLGWRSLFGGDVVVDSGHSNDGNYLQLKGDSSCGGPALGLTIKYGRLTLRSEQYLPATDGVAWNGPAMRSLMDSRWHDFVIRVNFAKDNKGWLEVWLDGQAQTMVNGQQRIYFPTVCPNDTKVFPKWGVYGMDEGIGAGPVHWVESPRIGTSYTAAAPR